MNPWNRRLGLPAFLSLAMTTCSLAQESRFQFESAKVSVGATYHYEKSNIDGSHRSNVSLHVAAHDRLESLKRREHESTATLVVAHIDLPRLSVRRFETWSLRAGSEPTKVVVAEYDPDQSVFHATAGDLKLSAQIQNRPWHSFDFDFASLNFAWRHLMDPEQSFHFGITDIVRTADGPTLIDKGNVTVDFQQITPRGGHVCREYLIDGPGLENRGGRIWIRKSDNIIVDYEIALPDEPGLESAKLLLTGVERMTPDQWQAFKSSCTQ